MVDCMDRAQCSIIEVICRFVVILSHTELVAGDDLCYGCRMAVLLDEAFWHL